MQAKVDKDLCTGCGLNENITPRRRVELALRGGHGPNVPFTMYSAKAPQCAAERVLRNRFIQVNIL